MAVERRQMIMGGVAAVLLVIAAWTWWPASTVPATKAATTAAVRGARPATADVPRPVAPVKLRELATTREEPGDGARNPFRFQPRVVAPPPRPVVTQPVIEAPRVAQPPPGPPPLPPIPLKLIGVLERANGVKWAVLSDGKAGPMYGKDGDIIDGRYLIVKIGTESIEMTYADGRGRQVIRLTGQ
jgi:hypothetical protein